MHYPKKLVFALIPVTLICVLSLLCLELWMRGQHTSWDPNGADSGPRSHRECYRLNITTGYEPIPNKCKRDDKGYYRTWDGPSKEDAYKVLVFGDSIADQHRWIQATANVLEKHMSRPVEFKNAGTPGFDTCSELQMFRDKGLNEDFDLLLLQFCPNDLASTATIIALPNDQVRFYIGWEYVEFPRWVLKYRTLSWLVLHTFNRQGNGNNWRASSSPIPHCLQEFRELAEQKGAEFKVILFPTFVDKLNTSQTVLQFEKVRLNPASAEEMSRNTVEEVTQNYFPIRNTFESRGLSLELYRNAPNDLWHPNNQGQNLIGKDVGRWLHDGSVP